MTNYRELQSCRAGGGTHLVSVLNLGQQSLTGVFPQSAEEELTKGPLELVWSPMSGLVQLKHTYDAAEMYGANYGYRSGVNQSMVDHLTQKVRFLEQRVELQADDVVLDIGSNDGTTLKSYSVSGLRRIGIDPTAQKFRAFIQLTKRWSPRQADFPVSGNGNRLGREGMTVKTALVTGALGQDGALLSQWLLSQDYRVIGVSARRLRLFERAPRN